LVCSTISVFYDSRGVAKESPTTDVESNVREIIIMMANFTIPYRQIILLIHRYKFKREGSLQEFQKSSPIEGDGFFSLVGQDLPSPSSPPP